MQLLLVGISHRTAPVDLRERVDFQTQGVGTALSAVAQRGSSAEAIIVSTCNRAEIYAACDEAEAVHRDLAAFMSEFHAIPAVDLAPHIYNLTGLDAARHLFRVAAGLQSVGVRATQDLGARN